MNRVDAFTRETEDGPKDIYIFMCKHIYIYIYMRSRQRQRRLQPYARQSPINNQRPSKLGRGRGFALNILIVRVSRKLVKQRMAKEISI